MGLSDILSIISGELEEVEQELDSQVQSPIPLVYDMSKYLLGSGGKRLRPSVLLLSSGLFNNNTGRSRIIAATALELIHTASLLHDDVVDDAKLRRGNASSNVVWGNKPTVLVGDFMLAKALGLLEQCGSLKLIKTVTDAASKLAEGQVLEVMNSENMAEVTREVCFKIIELKTASLIESCSVAGGILAGVSDDELKSVTVYGQNIGMAFQLVDDALDYSSNEQTFGKEVGQDLEEGKMTLPLLYALSESNEEQQKVLKDIMNKKDLEQDDLNIIRDAVMKHEGVSKTTKIAKEYVEKAKEAIDPLPESTHKSSLLNLAQYIVERDK